MASQNNGAAAAASSDDDDEQQHLSEPEILEAVKDLQSAKSTYKKHRKRLWRISAQTSCWRSMGILASMVWSRKPYLSLPRPTTTVFVISACAEPFSPMIQICCQQFAHFQSLLVRRAKFWSIMLPAQLCGKYNTKCDPPEYSFTNTSRQCQPPCVAAKYRCFSLAKKQSQSKLICRCANKQQKHLVRKFSQEFAVGQRKNRQQLRSRQRARQTLRRQRLRSRQRARQTPRRSRSRSSQLLLRTK